MKLENARKGVAKLFYAEVLVVLSAILVFTGALLVYLGMPAIGGILVLVGGILLIIGAILQFVGLYQSGKDSVFHHRAFWLVILLIIISVVNNFFNGRVSELVEGIISIINGLINFVVSLFIVYGISELATKVNRPATAAKGRLIGLVLVGLEFIGLLLNVLATFIKNPTGFFATIIALSAIIIGVVNLILAIVVFFYVWEGKKMLE
ncbi:MAG: hypothetical protein K5925_00015 [Bacilli bacterium]|nr:hypothetical protein [Bacilli bacterium]